MFQTGKRGSREVSSRVCVVILIALVLGSVALVGAAASDSNALEWGDIDATATDVGSTQAVVELDDIPDGADGLVVYETDDAGNQVNTVQHWADGLELTLRDLEPNSSYTVVIQAIDDERNESTDGPELSFETNSLDKLGWPSDAEIAIDEVTDRSMTVSFPEAEPATEITEYQFGLALEEDEQDPSYLPIQRNEDGKFELVDGPVTTHHEDGEITVVLDESLLPNSTFLVEVNAMIGDTSSNDSLSTSVTTDQADVPEWGEIDATVTYAGITQATIELDAVPDEAIDIDVRTAVPGEYWAEVDGTTISIYNLQPAATYSFSIEATKDERFYTDDGPTVTVTTDDIDAFGWPDDAELTVTETTDLSATLSWEAAEPADEIDYYYPMAYGPEGEIVELPLIERTPTGDFETDQSELTVDDGTFTYQTPPTLSPESEYQFDVIAQLVPEMSDPLSANATTGESVAPAWTTGSTLEITNVTDLTTELRWSEAEPSDEIQSYHLTVTESDEGVEVTTIEIDRGYDGTFSTYSGDLTIENGEFVYRTEEILVPETEYEFSVEAERGAERTDPITTNATTVLGDPPEWDHAATMDVGWETESTAEIYVSDYPIPEETFESLHYFDESGEELPTEEWWDLGHSVVDLAPNTTHEITVQARDEYDRMTENGPTVTVTTLPIDGPSDLTAEGTPTHMTLFWDGPETGNYILSRDGTEIATVPTDGDRTEFNYTDSSLDIEQEYEYQIVREFEGDLSEPIETNVTTGIAFATAKASYEDGGLEFSQRHSFEAAISGDGRYVVHAYGQIEDSLESIYRYDLETGERLRVSVDGPDGAPFDIPFQNPTISADGNDIAFTSEGHVYLHDVAADETILVSHSNDSPASGTSTNPSLSADGQLIVFESSATDLVDENVTGVNLYVYDRTSDSFELIPVGNAGLDLLPAISPDGERIAFQSTNTSVPVLPDAIPDGQQNIFVYDRSDGTLEWVSQPNDGEVPDGDSLNPSISESGEYVAFQSGATNMTADAVSPSTNWQEVYRWSSATGSVELVSVDNVGTPVTARYGTAISADGQVVVADTYRFDLESGVATDFSFNNAGESWTWSFSSGSPPPRDPSLSHDGSAVAYRVEPFGSNVPNIVLGDDGADDTYVTFFGEADVLDEPAWPADAAVETNGVLAGELQLTWSSSDDATFYEIYVDGEFYDRVTSDTTELTISGYYNLEPGETHEFRVEAVGKNGVRSTTGPSVDQTMAELGLPSTIGTQPYDDGFRFTWSDDLEGGTLSYVEVYRDGSLLGYGDDDEQYYLDYGLEPDTSYGYELRFYDEYSNNVSVGLTATTLERGDGIETTLLNLDGDGTRLNVSSGQPTMSADASVIAFLSGADPFELPDNASAEQIYVRNVADGTLELVSQPDGSENTIGADSNAQYPQLSSDGSVVVFRSEAGNLDESVREPDNQQLFIRDLGDGTTTLITRNVDGEPADNRNIDDAFDVSGDGERVVFTAGDGSIHPDVTEDDSRQVYLYDRATEEITLISRDRSGNPAEWRADSPQISDNGEYVTFESSASNLVDNVTNDQSDVYRYEVETGVLERVSVTPDGDEIPEPDGSSWSSDDAVSPTISTDGSTIAFLSESVAVGSTGDEYQIVIWEEATGTTTHVAIPTDSGNYEVETGQLVIGSEGRFIAFESQSDIDVPKSEQADSHVYVYDRLTGYIMQADVTSDGDPATEQPQLGIDLVNTPTPTVLYTSGATNLADDLVDGEWNAFATELTRFDQIAEVDPPSWPADPSLEATPLGQSTISLEWPPAFHEIGVDHYEVIVDNETHIIDGDRTNLVVDGLESETNYTITVSGIDATDQASVTLTTSVSTLGPDDLTPLVVEAQPGGIVELAWEEAVGDVTGYVIEERTDDGDWHEQATIDDVEITNTSVTGLLANQEYSYRLLTVDSTDVASSYSTVETVTTPDIELETLHLWDGDLRIWEWVDREATLTLEATGEPNREGTVEIEYAQWADPTHKTPTSETTTVALEERDEAPGEYVATFTVPEDTAQLTALTATLTDGESTATVTTAEQPVIVLADLEVEFDWPDHLEFPSGERLQVWSEKAGDGQTVTVEDGQETYSFDNIRIGDDGVAEYEARVREGVASRTLGSETTLVRAGLMNTITIDDPTVPAELRVIAETPSGERLKGVSITGQNVDTDRYLGKATTTSGSEGVELGQWTLLLPGEQIELSVRGTSSLPYQFDTVHLTEPLESGENVVVFELEDWPDPVPINGTVTDEAGEPVAGAPVTATQHFGPGSWDGFEYETTTDANGSYTLEVIPEYETDMTASIRFTDDYRGIAELDGVAVSASGAESVDIELNEQRHRNVSVGSVTYPVIGSDATTTLETFGRHEAGAMNTQVTFTEDGQTVQWNADRGGEYPYRPWISDGTEVTVCIQPAFLGITEQACETSVVDADTSVVEADFTYDDSVYTGLVTGQLVHLDGTPWTGTTSGWNRDWTATVYQLDEETGDYERQRWDRFDSGDTFSISLSDPGTYQLRFSGHVGYDAHVGVVEFDLPDGEAVALGDVEMAPGGRFGQQPGNDVTGPTDTVMPGGQTTIRGTLENTGEGAVDDAELRFDLPENLTYVSETAVTDFGASPTVDDGTLVFDLDTLDEAAYGSVRFDVAVDEVAEPADLGIETTIAFDDGLEREEWLGIADVRVGGVLVQAPGTVADRNVTVQGRAPGESTVRLYADGTQVATTQAAPNGFFRTGIELPIDDPPADVTLTAAVGDGADRQESPATTVSYDPDIAHLQSVTFWQSGEDQYVDTLPPIATGNIDFFLPAVTDRVTVPTEDEILTMPRTMLAGLPFHFELDYDDPDALENAYVLVEGPAGGIGEATYNEETGTWEAFIETDRAATWSLGGIYVITDLPESEQDGDRFVDDLPDRDLFLDWGDLVIDPAWKIDPSGYVYEVVEDNRIQNVTATVYEWDDATDQWVEWDAEWWGEENPQQTDASGWYGWDVPAGDWRVVYEKDGYETTYSQDYYGPIEVPPPHFEVNVPMKSLEPPEIDTVEVSDERDAVTLEFTRHIDVATVSEHTVFVQTTGPESEVVDADLVFPELVANPHTESDNETLARTIRIEPDEPLPAGEYELVVRDLVESYAEVPLDEQYEETVEVSTDSSFSASIDATNTPVTVGDTLVVDATIENEGGRTGSQDVTLIVNGEPVDSHAVELAPGDSTAIQLEYEVTDEDVGPLQLTVETDDDEQNIDVTVLSLANFDVEIVDAPDSVTEGDTIDVDVAVENLGDREDTQTIELVVDSSTVADEETLTLDGGETQTITLSYETGSSDVGTIDLTVNSADRSVSESVTVDEEDTTPPPRDPAEFEVTDASLNETVIQVGEQIEATASIENVGERSGTFTAELLIDGEVVDDYRFGLSGGSTEDVTFTESFDDAGEYDIEISDVHAGTLTVSELPEADITVTEATIDDTEIQVGETAIVTATIENAGNASGTFATDLMVHGEVVNTQNISLDAGESEPITFTEQFDTVGEYQIAVNDVDAGTLTVTEPAVPDVDVTNAELDRTEIQTGEAVEVTADLENAGTAGATVTVDLFVDGDVVDSKEIEIKPDASTTVTFTEQFDTVGEYQIAVNDVDAGTLTVEAPAPPEPAFEVDDASLSETAIETGDSVDVTGQINNVGDGDGTFTVELLVDGDVVTEVDVTLEAGESEMVVFTEQFDEAGEYQIAVNDANAGTLTVEAPEPTGPAFETTDAGLSETEIEEGESVDVTATVENIGEEPGAVIAELFVDGEPVDDVDVTLEVGETETVTFTESFDDAGEYHIEVNEAEAGTVTVAESDDSIPGFGPLVAISALAATLIGLRFRRRFQ